MKYMMRHLFANLWLLLLTLLLCSVAYPLALLAVAQLPFLKDKADGSLLVGADGKVIGSRLEAQAFEEDEYFWPRPSAASYKGDGTSGSGSNLSASNPDLRQRVEYKLLGAVLKYGDKSPKKGQMIWPDVEKWFVSQRGLLAKWAEANPDLAKAWVKDNALNTKYVDGWKKTDEGKNWLKGKTAADPATLKPEDLAVEFLKFCSHSYAGKWPVIKEPVEIHPDTGANMRVPLIERVESSREIRTYFYPMWREAHPNEDLAPVPADMVTASGSGLDPHITLNSANYQFDRVRDAWAAKRNMPKEKVAERLQKLLDAHKHAPLGGLAGVELVNVMEVNAALKMLDW
jgi:K+-transporting ATPase ATPase C chain